MYTMPKTQTDYSATIIYKLCCKDPEIDDIYIGHTTNFIQRKNRHKTASGNINYNSYVYMFIRDHGGWDNWSMIQIEQHNCNNKREAEAIEHEWIEKLNPTLNTNKPYAKCKEEPQIYKQKWYENNKETILEKNKQNYEENKVTKLEYSAKYAQEHKEKITNYNKQYRELNKEKLSEQKKIYRETNKEAIALSIKKWTDANKDKIKAHKSQIIECECGHSYALGYKQRHLKSDKHLKPFEEKEKEEISEEEKQEKLIKAKEQQQKYRQTHSEQISQAKKKHYELHKEQIMEQNKAYRELHKEQIMEQQKLYVEENQDKIKEKKNEWYQQNKDKIKAKQSELMTCECGAEIRRAGKAEHCRSKKHQDFMQTNIHIS
jgi:hypothetical protein